ncbi:hypothetical protein BD410DRAFT_389779 [Rickenella mellea]|uniref:Uncharacterized protein n=1 Tax=Rickenella mellea TaxID=50990 RepID=A0A4Y7PYF8_9AGAM|nr:hypothetical protein BD410DRAFT_389779 [Rickenella mellea]
MEQQQHWAHQKTTDWTKPPAGGSTVVFPVAGGGGGGGGGNGNDIPFVHELPPWFTPMTTMQSLPTPGGSAPPKSLRSTIAGSGSSTLSPADKTGDWVRSQENTPKHTHRNGAADDGWGHGTSERNGSLLNQYGRPGAQAAPFGGAGPSSLSSSSTTLHQPPSGTGAHTRSASYGGAADGRNYSLSSVGSVSGSGSGAGLRRPSSPMPHAGGSHSRSNSSAHALSPKSSQKYGTVAGLSNVVGSITLRGDPSLSRAADPSHTPGQNGFHPTSDALARSNTSILGPSLSSRRSAGHVGPGAPITVQTSSAGSNGRRTPHIDGLPGGAERGDAFGFSGYGNPRPESRNALPIPNPSIDPRRGASNAADPGGPVIPRSHRTSELSYVDPDPSVFPISAPSMSRRRSRRDSGASRHSTSSATSTVRRSRGVPLPSSTYRDTSNYDSHAYPIPPPQSRSRSPASSVASTAARGRRVALPASTAGDSTRERRAYPGTPFQRPSPTLEDDEDEDNGFPGGFREDVADHDHALKRSTSRISVSSNKSHKHYDRNEFLDPAFLAIDTNMFLSNGGSGGPSRFSGAYN